MQFMNRKPRQNNGPIAANISAIRTDLGLSQEQFAEAIGTSQTTISAWENGQDPRRSNIEQLLERFPQYSLEDIYGVETGFAKTLGRPAPRRVPCAPLFGSIAGGSLIEMLPVTEYVEIPASMLARYPHAFYLRISGESMNRVIPNGSFALIDPSQQELIDGQLYALRVNGSDATIKRVRVTLTTVTLVPESFSPSFEPAEFERVAAHESIESIGRVVWFCAPLPRQQ